MEAPQTDSPYLPDGRQWAWDSTSLSLAKDCSRKYYLAQRWGYRPKDESVHLTFGKHYASALERYHKFRVADHTHKDSVRSVVGLAMTESFGQLDATALADLSGGAKYKTRENLIRSIVWYLDQFENDPCETVTLANGDAAVELSFKFQLTDEIWLTGHLDRLVNYAGEVYVQDQKTTGATLGAYYFKRYSPDNQMSLYAAASQIVFNSPVKGVMIDAAQIAAGFTRFERGITLRTAEQTAEWLKDAEYHIKLTWAAAEHGYPMNDSACVSGDTVVSVTRGSRKGWKLPIAKLHKLFNKEIKYPMKDLPTYILSDLGGVVGNNLITDIFSNGVKPVFHIKTQDGQEIKATADHRFNTPYGWKRVDELNEGDVLFYWRSGKPLPLDKKKGWTNRASISKLYYYPYGYMPQSKSEGIRKRKLGATQRVSRLTVEAELNGLSLEDFVWILQNDPYEAKKLNYLSPQNDVHHIDKDTSDDASTNLASMTAYRHHQEHSKESSKLSQTIITSIEAAGEETVFDISMKAPHHNFIANGLVAHNCQKYGGCPFVDVCSKSPQVRDDFLATGFEKRFWNPLETR